MDRMRSRLATSQDDAGFTLIELLIVIVVLGILAGIAIFAVGSFQQDAKDACKNANDRIEETVDAAKTVNSSATYTVSTQAGNCV